MGIKYAMVEQPVRTAKVKAVVGYTCDGCGHETDEDYHDWEWMIPIRVEAGESGEEGNQIVEKVYCDQCAEGVLDKLIALGFSTHYHGSTNFLEDPCVGEHVWENCPNRQKSRYGNIQPEDEEEWADDEE